MKVHINKIVITLDIVSAVMMLLKLFGIITCSWWWVIAPAAIAGWIVFITMALITACSYFERWIK